MQGSSLTSDKNQNVLKFSCTLLLIFLYWRLDRIRAFDRPKHSENLWTKLDGSTALVSSIYASIFNRRERKRFSASSNPSGSRGMFRYAVPDRTITLESRTERNLPNTITLLNSARLFHKSELVPNRSRWSVSEKLESISAWFKIIISKRKSSLNNVKYRQNE